MDALEVNRFSDIGSRTTGASGWAMMSDIVHLFCRNRHDCAMF